jgi:hypothetical protein
MSPTALTIAARALRVRDLAGLAKTHGRGDAAALLAYQLEAARKRLVEAITTAPVEAIDEAATILAEEGRAA